MPYPSILFDKFGNPIPIVYNSDTGVFEVDEGKRVLYDGNGNPIFTSSNPGKTSLYDSAGNELYTESNPAIVQQTGSIVSLNGDGSIASEKVKEYRCLSTDTKIDASTVPKYSYLIEVDTDNIYYSDGTNWVMK